MHIDEYLETFCEEVTPKEFYRTIFPAGELEERGKYVSGKYCGIAVQVPKQGRRFKRYSLTDELSTIDELCASDCFTLMSPISYAGKERKSDNARFLYAMAIDVDGIQLRDANGAPEGMATLFYQFDGHGPSNYLPLPTFIVFSGTGIHLYYVFEEAIPLFPNVVKELSKLKKRLTWQLWTQGVVDRQHREHIQYESLFQGFRVPGTITKAGGRARAFMVDHGKKVTLEYLNQFVPDSYKAGSLVYKSKLTLKDARKKYPEWYEKRIVQKRPRGTWTCKRDLYDWWKRKIVEGGVDGHRFWCIMTLATYAVKCDIPREELEADAMGFIDLLDSRGTRPDNPFTADDVLSALEAYNDKYIRYPIHAIEDRTGIQIPRNRRNGRKQVVHLRVARAIQAINDEVNGTTWRNTEGRPSKEHIVRDWQARNPGRRKADCIRETGLSRPTVYKYWT